MQATAVFVPKAPVLEDEEESFELCYNKACQLLSKGDWANAEKVKF